MRSEGTLLEYFDHIMGLSWDTLDWVGVVQAFSEEFSGASALFEWDWDDFYVGTTRGRCMISSMFMRMKFYLASHDSATYFVGLEWDDGASA